jgi:hypothetical protein
MVLSAEKTITACFLAQVMVSATAARQHMAHATNGLRPLTLPAMATCFLE